MRVTDVDELRKRIARITCAGGWSKRILIQFVDEAPTTELVRCRDCVNWDTDWTPTRADPGEHFCPITGLIKSGDWFCADGERKEEGE